MSFNKIIFYNHFGAGDIFESREFVRAWISKFTVDEYYYAHGKNPKIILDMPELVSMDVTPNCDPRTAVLEKDNILYINTWIGRDGRYVLPGIGCTVEMLYRMHNDMLRLVGASPLTKHIIDYVPNIDYKTYWQIDNVNEWLRMHPERKILISNGPVQSNQAENFDFSPAIINVAKNFPDYTFIITQPFEHGCDNIFDTDYIVFDKSGFDLNEISYLSTFCDTLIGRNSGPHVFSQVKDNWLDENKVILSFTYKEIASTFVLQQPVKMKKLWSSATHPSLVADDMIRAIARD